MSDLAAALLRDVPIRGRIYTGGNCLDELVLKKDVLAALTAALDPALTERAERISTECLQAAEVMQDTNTFQTGQAIFLDASDLITTLLAQNAALRAERDAQRRDLEKTIRNQRAELRRLQALERVHWRSVERWRGTREGLEGKVKAAEAEVEKLRGELQNATEAKLDAISTLDAWFDRRKLGHDAVDQAVVDAASGYLRTSRVGGMQQAESDLILGVMRDMARLGLFADLFARAALKGDDHE